MKKVLWFLKNDEFMKIIWLSLATLTLVAVLNQCVIESKIMSQEEGVSQGEGVRQGEGTNTISPSLCAEKMGFGGLVFIGHGLYYDSSTMVVYWWNGYFGSSKYATTPTAYYAPNGMPYKYNPSTNSLEEIK